MELIDLTMPIAPGMPYNPDHFPPQISSYASLAVIARYSYTEA